MFLYPPYAAKMLRACDTAHASVSLGQTRLSRDQIWLSLSKCTWHNNKYAIICYNIFIYLQHAVEQLAQYANNAALAKGISIPFSRAHHFIVSSRSRRCAPSWGARGFSIRHFPNMQRRIRTNLHFREKFSVRA